MSNTSICTTEQVTTSIFTSEQIKQFVVAFKEKAKARQITATDIMLYNWVRGLPLNRGFTPITNVVKLANGAVPDAAFKNARFSLTYELRKNTTTNPRVALSYRGPAATRLLGEKFKAPLPFEGLFAVLNPTQEQCDAGQQLS